MNFIEFLKKLRPYTLLISIISGFIVFCIFHYVKEAVVLKPIAYFVSDTLPAVLFLILFFAFCKIDFRQMSPQRWHFFCVAFQIVSTGLIAWCLSANQDATTAIFLEGLMICFITPTAASASVITGKLGGNESSLTTYIILSNLAASIVIPLILPLVNNTNLDNFFNDFLLILSKVSPLLVLPLVLAVVIKIFFKKLHLFIIQHTKDIGFYMSVPVHWIKYDKVTKVSPIVVTEINSTNIDYKQKLKDLGQTLFGFGGAHFERGLLALMGGEIDAS